MKRLLMMMIGLLALGDSFGQNTTWATSGNIGIATTAPNAPLQVGNPGYGGGWQYALFQDGISVASSTDRKHTYLYSGGVNYFGINAFDFQANTYLPLSIGWGGSNVYIARTGGNVGIGTTTPSATLQVGNPGSASIWQSAIFQNGIGVAASGSSKHTYLYSDNTGYYGINAYDYQSNTYLPLTIGWGANNVYIAGDGGNVGIGTRNPGPYRLAVEGTVGVRKLKVTQVNPWADFVFDPSYELKPLSQIEAFIKENRRLPEVPSAKEVEKNGVDVGETAALLLKKIEELTLYVIDLKKENEEQNKKIERLIKLTNNK